MLPRTYFKTLRNSAHAYEATFKNDRSEAQVIVASSNLTAQEAIQNSAHWIFDERPPLSANIGPAYSCQRQQFNLSEL